MRMVTLPLKSGIRGEGEVKTRKGLARHDSILNESHLSKFL